MAPDIKTRGNIAVFLLISLSLLQQQFVVSNPLDESSGPSSSSQAVRDSNSPSGSSRPAGVSQVGPINKQQQTNGVATAGTGTVSNHSPIRDSAKEVTDYGPELGEIRFVETERMGGQGAVDALLKKHHNETELYNYLLKLSQDYPRITRLYSVGKSQEGRELWVLEITENPGEHQRMKPEFRYIANMHGNEVVGRELLLHLARVLVENYDASDERDDIPTATKYVKKLLKQVRIHLMPTMNPDGYARAVVGCRYVLPGKKGRLNANSVDLNRNFPDSMLNTTEDQSIQPETRAVMDWHKKERIPFVLSANLHGGALVVVIPYDSNSDNPNETKKEARPTPDDDVFQMLALKYSSNVPRDNTDYDACYVDGKLVTHPDEKNFTDGISPGAEWYPMHRSMQDWIYDNTNEFDVTIELGRNQYPPADRLRPYWELNKRALLNYINEATKGIKGTVRDALNGTYISGVNIHVRNRAHNVTSTEYGDYFRPLAPGFYSILFEHPDYKTEEMKHIEILGSPAQIYEIKLFPVNATTSSTSSQSSEASAQSTGTNDPTDTSKESSSDSSIKDDDHSIIMAIFFMTLITLIMLLLMVGAYFIQKKRLTRSQSMSVELQCRSASTGISLPPLGNMTSGGSTSHLVA